MVNWWGLWIATGGSYAGGANRSPKYGYLVKPELDNEAEMQALDARLREAEQEVETKDTCRSRRKNTWFLFKIRVSKHVWATAGPLAYQGKPRATGRNSGTLRSFRNRLATDATQFLQEELESLTEQFGRNWASKENLNRDIETMKSIKMFCNKSTELGKSNWQNCDFNRRNKLEPTKLRANRYRRLEETISSLEP